MSELARVSIQRDEFGVVLTEYEDGHASLQWTDFVANDWAETYTTFAEGLMRLALLDHCVKGGKFFSTHEPKEFAVAANAFMETQLS